jgi:hypothetical protein
MLRVVAIDPFLTVWVQLLLRFTDSLPRGVVGIGGL